MTWKAYIIIASIFLIAFSLLGVGHCGYREINSMQSLEKKIEKIRKDFPEIEHVEADTVASILKSQEKGLLLIDCREESEFQLSRIPGAVHLQTVRGLERFLQAEGRERPTSIIVYCSVGQRSAELAKDLNRAKYPRVRNFVGSIFQWANEDRPLVDAMGDKAEKVHPYNKFWGRLLKDEKRAQIEKK